MIMSLETAQSAFQLFLWAGLIVVAVCQVGSSWTTSRLQKEASIKRDLESTKVDGLVQSNERLESGNKELLSKNQELLGKVERYQVELDRKNVQIEVLEKKATRAGLGITSTFDFNGARRNTTAGTSSVVAGEETTAFARIMEAEKEKDFTKLKDITTVQIKKTPDWLTPYLFRGIANANLGDRTAAEQDLSYVVKNSGGHPDYAQAEQFLKQLQGSQ